MEEDIQNKQIKVGKLDIHYITGGEGEPLLVIHGGGDGANSWLETADNLSERYRIYVPDLPGFGRSQPIANDNNDILDFVKFIDDFSDNLSIKRFHLIGHSFGSDVALHYTLRFPKKIIKLVLLNSIHIGITPWVKFLSSPFFCKTLGLPAHFILEATKWLVHLFYSPSEFRNPLSRSKIALANYVITLKEQGAILVNQLSELMLPTLLVCGAKDIIVPISQAHSAAQLFPNGQLKIFENCGHNVHNQESKEFSRLMKQFLG